MFITAARKNNGVAIYLPGPGTTSDMQPAANSKPAVKYGRFFFVIRSLYNKTEAKNY
jgi:hypothetical protein